MGIVIAMRHCTQRAAFDVPPAVPQDHTIPLHEVAAGLAAHSSNRALRSLTPAGRLYDCLRAEQRRTR